MWMRVTSKNSKEIRPKKSRSEINPQSRETTQTQIFTEEKSNQYQFNTWSRTLHTKLWYVAMA